MAVWSDGLPIFAVTPDGDVFASEDPGDTWSHIAADRAPVSKNGHHRLLPRDASGVRGG